MRVIGNVHSELKKADGSAGGKGKGRKKFDFGEKARADVANEGLFCDQTVFNNNDNVAKYSGQCSKPFYPIGCYICFIVHSRGRPDGAPTAHMAAAYMHSCIPGRGHQCQHVICLQVAVRRD